MLILTMIFVVAIGLVVGSFLNVVILRLHAGRDFVKGRSACPGCGHELGTLELIPVVSWVGLRGRCKHCRKPISIQYPLVELLTAIVFALAYLHTSITSYGDLAVFVLWLYILGSLIVLAVYDLKWYLLPDKVLLPLIVPATAIIIASSLQSRSLHVLWGPLAAALLFGGAFYAVAALSRGKWMGGGDIKLAFVMGLLLGLQKTALAMMIAFDTAAVVGLVLIALRRKKRSDMIPFGPFLILGTVVSHLYGATIITWYLRVVGFGA
jgi:prepilin signal peptidase PulO-like enzyme (type II secretory pathway)